MFHIAVPTDTQVTSEVKPKC